MTGPTPRLWPRVVVIVVASAIAGWAGYTVYEHRAPPPAAPSSDPRIASFLEEGYAHLDGGRTERAREAFTKASALAPDDGEVWEARLRADVQAADAAWRRWRFSPDGEPRQALLDAFDREIDQARARIAEALRHPGLSGAMRTRLALEERRLNALLIAAFAEMGQHERAAGAFSARLEGKPEASELAAFVDRSRTTLDAGDADEADAGAIEDAGAADARAPDAGAAPLTPPRPAPFEFEHEPIRVPPTPGELEMPGSP
jgi:tetratricopeptide (TPR) repeat protein